jgi:hypothetical protein
VLETSARVGGVKIALSTVPQQQPDVRKDSGGSPHNGLSVYMMECPRTDRPVAQRPLLRELD